MNSYILSFETTAHHTILFAFRSHDGSGAAAANSIAADDTAATAAAVIAKWRPAEAQGKTGFATTRGQPQCAVR